MALLTITSPWLQFKHHLVRELAFCIASPPLLQAWPENQDKANSDGSAFPQQVDLPDTQFWQTQFEQYLPRLKQLDQNPAVLEQHMLSLRSTRLGLRFEHLLAFWLQDNAYHHFKLIERSIQRMQGQRTLGELDFLIKNCCTGQIEHWEVAIKFYLGEASFAADHWLGLNRRDSLGRKINHLQQHQFNVRQAVGHTIDRQRAIIKGRLFYPLAHFIIPSWINPSHLTGRWGSFLPLAPAHYAWRYASRSEWIAPLDLNPPSGMAPYLRQGLYLLLNTNNQVVLQYMLRITNKTHNPIHSHNILETKDYVTNIFN